jgi:hypothetical protein
MARTYKEPEFTALKTTGEDVLTASTLDDYTSGWEAGGGNTGGSEVPFIEI